MSKSILMFVCLFAFCACFAGCETATEKESAKKGSGEKHDHDHGHGEKDPFAGLGDESYHQGHGANGFIYKTSDPAITAEVKIDADNDSATIFLRDEKMKEENPQEIESLTIETPGDKPMTFTLEAANAKDGKASQFTASDEPQLPIALSQRCWIKFKVGDKEVKSWVFPHGAH